MSLIDFSLGDVGGILTSAREAITGKKITDPLELAKIDLQLKTLQNGLDTGQMQINKVEAAHPSKFVAGWRPFIGWVCGIALMFNMILFPIVEWGCLIAAIVIPEPPVLDTQSLMTLLGGMLGFGTMRTYEKYKNVEHRR